MTTHSVTAYRVRTTAGSQISVVEEMRDRPPVRFAPLTPAEGRALGVRLIFLAQEAERDDIETTGGVPPTREPIYENPRHPWGTKP